MYIVYTKHGPKLFHTSKKISTFYGPKAFQAEVDYLIGNWDPMHTHYYLRKSFTFTGSSSKRLLFCIALILLGVTKWKKL